MTPRSRKKLTVKNDGSAGISNANGSAMADQSTTANTVASSPANNMVNTSAIEQTAEQSPVAKPSTATQREQFESGGIYYMV